MDPPRSYGSTTSDSFLDRPSTKTTTTTTTTTIFTGLLHSLVLWTKKTRIVLAVVITISIFVGHVTTLLWALLSKGQATFSNSSHMERAQRLAQKQLQFLNQQNTFYYKDPLLANLVSPSPVQSTTNQLVHQTEPFLGAKNHNAVLPLNGCEGTIIILRHCEKGSLREHCAYIGYERAIYLSTLFGSSPDHRWPKPTYLYALSAGGRTNTNLRNWREVETLLPLSQRINVPIDDSYGVEQTNDLSLHILTDLIQPGYLCGKVALISWKHDDIPHLAHQLGCGPLDGCPDVYPSNTFDDAWQIKFAYHFPFHDESTVVHTFNRDTESVSTTSTSNPIQDNPQWFVYGTVLQENFDPLAFSKKMGDYSEEEGWKGKKKWMNITGEENVPENALGTIVGNVNNTNRI